MGQRNFQPKHHRKTIGRSFNGRQAIEKLYDRRWKKYCARFLGINRECYACGKPANTVDHLIPHQGDVKLFEKLDNHIPLCEKCHNTVTSLFDRRYRAGNSVTPKIKWLNKNRMPTETWAPKRVKVLTEY